MIFRKALPWPNGLTREGHDALRAFTRIYDRLGDGVPDQVLKYLVSGHPDDFPLRLWRKMLATFDMTLQMQGSAQTARTEWATTFQKTLYSKDESGTYPVLQALQAAEPIMAIRMLEVVVCSRTNHRNYLAQAALHRMPASDRPPYYWFNEAGSTRHVEMHRRYRTTPRLVTLLDNISWISAGPDSGVRELLLEQESADEGYLIERMIPLTSKPGWLKLEKVAKSRGPSTLTGKLFERNPVEIKTRLEHEDPVIRAVTTAYIALHRTTAAFLDEILKLAVGNAKLPRLQASAALQEIPDIAWEPVLTKLKGGKADERCHAADLLISLDAEKALPILKEQAATEKTARVRNTIGDLIANHTGVTVDPHETATEESAFAIPPEPLADITDGPLPEGVRAEFHARKKKEYEVQLRKYQHAEKLGLFKENPETPAEQLQKMFWQGTKPADINENAIDRFLDFITANDPIDQATDIYRPNRNRAADQWLILQAGLNLKQQLRAFSLRYATDADTSGMKFWRCEKRGDLYDQPLSPSVSFSDWYRRSPVDLRIVARLLGTTGKREDYLASVFLMTANEPVVEVDTMLVWPYFWTHRELLHQGLKGTDPAIRLDRTLQVIAMLPSLPDEFILPLVKAGLRDNSRDRKLVRGTLADDHRVVPHLLKALDGNAEERLHAADWLADLGAAEAVEPITRLVRKEKAFGTRAGMLAALDRLGGNVDPFLGKKALENDTAKILAKAKPDDLSWVPWGDMPSVHWRGEKALVPDGLVRGLLHMARKHKEPGHNPHIALVLDRFEPDDASRLGHFILKSWIAQEQKKKSQSRIDILINERKEYSFRQHLKSRPIGLKNSETRLQTLRFAHEQAVAKGDETNAKQLAEQVRYVQAQVNRSRLFLAKSEEEQRQELMPGIAKMVRLSPDDILEATPLPDKGVLAIASAAGNADCLPLIKRFMRETAGRRRAQIAAVFEVLCNLEGDDVLQEILRISARFRLKSIEARAQEEITDRAEERGWSVEELADRTIPTGGLEEDGRLLLDFGSRQLTASLDDRLRLQLQDETGKVLKSLPKPRVEDDKELAREAKKAWQTASKTIKATLKTQTARLEAAMIAQYAWPLSMAREYLFAHPVMGRLCTGFVWAAWDGIERETIALAETEPSMLFRPTSAGAFVDANGGDVDIPDGALVTLVHPAMLDPVMIEKWADVQRQSNPVFPQILRLMMPGCRDLEFRLGREDIDDFDRHRLPFLKTRSLLEKRGYRPSEIIDAGGYNYFVKPYPEADIIAAIEIEEAHVGAANLEEITLRKAWFGHLGTRFMLGNSGTLPQAFGAPFSFDVLPFEKVPPTILSETFVDYQQVAKHSLGLVK